MLRNTPQIPRDRGMVRRLISLRSARYDKNVLSPGIVFVVSRKQKICEPFQFDLPCPAVAEKMFRFSFLANQLRILRHPAPAEGRFAIVTNVERDAVDADALLTNSAKADGEVVWSRRPDAGVKSRRNCAAMVARKPVTRESTKETVKTIAQETPGVPVNLW